MAVATPTLPARSPARQARLEHLGLGLDDGLATTLHIARFERAAVRCGVIAFPRPRRLLEWCAQVGVRHAIVAGFFVRPGGMPLGELRIGGVARDHEPFAPPWGGRRGSLLIRDGAVEIARRPDLPGAPDGDLIEIGPLLIEGRSSVVDSVADPEGFSASSHQFDSDITAGRYPRAALGLTDDELLAVASDGRAVDEAGLTLTELAEAMAALGAHTAINLDGGGSTSLVFDGVLRNAPREEHGILIPGGRPVATALVFEPLAQG